MMTSAIYVIHVAVTLEGFACWNLASTVVPLLRTPGYTSRSSFHTYRTSSPLQMKD
ncbi:hypothetical protein BDV26DRAFT_261851 [Aspergillus bertholletiae]|uniref:Uncharacterized protein n=1 Tax=Aspergillus bertholletiae TaxID=1226010 RepID=A0A5N7B9E7_9EURO|nr:hypothetical protein BDV26DRAFT_261851 [Aspergillus bertholletiae]